MATIRPPIRPAAPQTMARIIRTPGVKTEGLGYRVQGIGVNPDAPSQPRRPYARIAALSLLRLASLIGQSGRRNSPPIIPRRAKAVFTGIGVVSQNVGWPRGK